MSHANEKGGYQKGLEITRENSNRSTTSLSTDFLKKSENYILNITDFVTNTAPPMNTLSGVYFTVRPLGDQGETTAQAEANSVDSDQPLEFKPTVYRSWLELGRQMEVFFKKVTDTYNELTQLGAVDNYAVFYMSQDGKMFLSLSVELVSNRYIEFAPAVQKILGMSVPYVFKVREAINVGAPIFTDQTVVGGAAYSLFAADGTFRHNYRTFESEAGYNFAATRPLVNFEQRESIDVYSTFPLKSKVLAYDGKETHEHILFRLPYAEQHSFVSTSVFEPGQALNRLANISENLDIGLTNMCDKHANTLHQTLLTGKIRNIQLRIAVRYMTPDGIVERDMDFSNGFWYLRLLFVKKV